MQSSNPVFNRSEGFNGRGQNTTSAASGMSYPAYGAPADAGSRDASEVWLGRV